MVKKISYHDLLKNRSLSDFFVEENDVVYKEKDEKNIK